MTEALWIVGRGTGVASLVLLTVVVALGVATRSRRPALGLRRYRVASLHRTASLLAVVLLVLHGSSASHHYPQLSLMNAFIPFTGAYRPLWLGLGALASDLVLTLVVTSLLHRRVGHRAWRAVHWTAYAAWPLALAHGLGTGTDAGQPWLRAIAAACLAAVLACVGWRCTATFTTKSRSRSRPTYASTSDRPSSTTRRKTRDD